MDFTYLSQPPKRFTFEQPKLKLWCEKWCSGKGTGKKTGGQKGDCE